MGPAVLPLTLERVASNVIDLALRLVLGLAYPTPSSLLAGDQKVAKSIGWYRIHGVQVGVPKG
jgi:hypothetical protein